MTSRRKKKPTTLYSLWRNSDDRLLILDGTAEDVCAILGLKSKSFYEIMSRTGGDMEAYTIRKIRREDAEREEET